MQQNVSMALCLVKHRGTIGDCFQVLQLNMFEVISYSCYMIIFL